MFVRTIAAAALSVAVLASGSAFAAGESTGFDAQLAATKAAAIGVTSIQAERSDRDLANSYIVMAQSLANQGDLVKAQDFLNFARGKLGLVTQERTAQAESGNLAPKGSVASSVPVVQVGQAVPPISTR